MGGFVSSKPMIVLLHGEDVATGGSCIPKLDLRVLSLIFHAKERASCFPCVFHAQVSRMFSIQGPSTSAVSRHDLLEGIMRLCRTVPKERFLLVPQALQNSLRTGLHTRPKK